MYIPDHFLETDTQKIVEFIRSNPFATLVGHDGDKPLATHLPFEITGPTGGQFVLEAHCARANPQWRTLEGGAEALVIFSGPNAQISPSWYERPHSTVPTWSYMAVHVYGKPRLMSGEDELREHLGKLIGRYEAHTSYDVSKVPKENIDEMVKEIVGFTIAVSRFEAAFKLNQNRSRGSYENIIAELEKRPEDDSHKIAEAMRSTEPV